MNLSRRTTARSKDFQAKIDDTDHPKKVGKSPQLPRSQNSYQNTKISAANGHDQDLWQATQADSLINLEQFKSINILPGEMLPWGSIVSRSPKIPRQDLQEVAPDADGRYNVHRLGRNAVNDIVFRSSERISNFHCEIYCRENRSDPQRIYLEPYIIDKSVNGTFINNDYTRLEKNFPRLLHKGDEVYLVNPDLVKNLEELQLSSFTFISNIIVPHHQNTKSSSLFKAFDTESDQNQDVSPLNRSNTIVKLLDKGRNIYHHYDISRTLGSGTNGIVYLGVEKHTGKEWAIKKIDIRMLLISNITDANVIKEAELLRSLRHPFITHLEDIFSDNQNIYLVMELCHGGDLFDRIVSKKFYEEDEAREVTIQMLFAMEYLHDNKVAHRDLKPENILLVSQNNDVNIKLTDFGLAKKVDESGGGKMKTFCGTPLYFAPEVLQRQDTVYGLGSYTIAADMWSIGVILFVLLCGEFPFSSDAEIKGDVQIICNKSSRWHKVSSDVKDLTMKLLDSNPNSRLTAKQALQHSWIVPGLNHRTKESLLPCDMIMTTSKQMTSTPVHEDSIPMMVTDNNTEFQMVDSFLTDRFTDGVLHTAQTEAATEATVTLKTRSKRAFQSPLPANETLKQVGRGHVVIDTLQEIRSEHSDVDEEVTHELKPKTTKKRKTAATVLNATPEKVNDTTTLTTGTPFTVLDTASPSVVRRSTRRTPLHTNPAVVTSNTKQRKKSVVTSPNPSSLVVVRSTRRRRRNAN